MVQLMEKIPFYLNLWLRWKFSARKLGGRSLSRRLKNSGLRQRLRYSVIHCRNELSQCAKCSAVCIKALYIGKLSLPADVIEISWLFLFMVELMAQNTSKSISKIFLSLVFHDIKLKLVSNCFFVSIKRYIKEELSLIKKWKKFTS